PGGGEVRQAHRYGRAALLLVDHHDGEGAIGGARGSEGREVIGVGYGRGHADIAKHRVVAVVVAIDLAGEISDVVSDGIGAGVFGDRPAGRQVEAFAPINAEHV